MAETILSKLNKKAVAIHDSGLLRTGYMADVAQRVGKNKMVVYRVMKGEYTLAADTVNEVLEAVKEDAKEHLIKTKANTKKLINIINK